MQFMLEKGFQIRIHIAWNKMACERCSKCETLLIKRTCQWDVNQMCSMNFLTKWVSQWIQSMLDIVHEISQSFNDEQWWIKDSKRGGGVRPSKLTIRIDK